MRDFEGKVDIVTGASRRIGAAPALEFGRRGASVAITYLTNKERAEKVGAGIEKAGGKALVLRTDVRDRAAIRAMVDRTAEAFGGVDILVNNARIIHPRVSFLEMDWDRDMWPMLEVHLAAPFHVCQAAVPHMLKRGGGAILNVLSASFRRGEGELHAYAAAKSALRGFTLTLANDLGPQGIRVNSVSPGVIETPEFKTRRTEEQRQKVVMNTPLRRIGSPEDVAATIAFLCSGQAGYITGEDIVIAGGKDNPF
ncbi:MAG: glucose 1-dehydrogenase [Candidatus Tectomicrobia bacterium]|nr:glucose 1-dehydrogenase [Candidatus Tectomicrobia bacterium]